jgi:predicted esterase
VTKSSRSFESIHADGRVVRAGVAMDVAERAMILVHGRGATPESIVALTDELPSDLGFAFVAPGASESGAHPRSWYPNSFLAPIGANEPGLSSGLARIEEAVVEMGEHGFGPENIILLGFSQGACLTVEFAARRAARWGGVVALTGGLVGDADAPRDHAGGFHGTPVFLGCSDRDPHVPLWRVDETEEVLRRMGAEVEKRIYPGMPHTVSRDELDWVESAMRRLAHQGQDESLQVGIHSG